MPFTWIELLCFHWISFIYLYKYVCGVCLFLFLSISVLSVAQFTSHLMQFVLVCLWVRMLYKVARMCLLSCVYMQVGSWTAHKCGASWLNWTSGFLLVSYWREDGDTRWPLCAERLAQYNTHSLLCAIPRSAHLFILSCVCDYSCTLWEDMMGIKGWAAWSVSACLRTCGSLWLLCCCPSVPPLLPAALESFM